MCRGFGWKKPLKKDEPPNPEFVKAREGFRDALVQQFNALYGTDEDDLTSWQNLCCVLNLADVPDELETCRNLVASMHVNIIDLIDTPVTQDPIIHFKSEEHLSIYTLHTGKKFPRDNVYSGDLLRFLLRKIDAYAWRPLAIDWQDNTSWARDGDEPNFGSKCKSTRETTYANLDSMFRNRLTLDEGRERLTQLFESIGDPRAHVRAFFNRDEYGDFDYQPMEPVMGEFYRMCNYYRWSSAKDANRQYIDPDREMASRGFKDALTLQFNAIYGTDENSLMGWQNLCVVLNLSDVPGELDACRDLVRSMYVNIIDLVEVPITLRFVEHFKTEMALSKYTKRHGKYFPLDNAYAGGLLKFLLRRIMVPRKSPDDPIHDSDSDHQSDPVILSVLSRRW
ncbi:unnamed protein product [Rhizoctonia solani]|uniref:Uncharacterized protein n=1 Tax=Rhizoctonia solani TaxID=456999 RepID=A0A8H2XMS8_9AGAM|nr:unnamed protein product [Rhizoctonia solani]